MAITGTGTENDPYIITTYDELVEKAATASEVFIKVGNDINIAEEYPHGDMPPLIVTDARIDGDNKIISNWYCTSNQSAIQITGTSTAGSTKNPQIKNLNIINILHTNTDNRFISLSYGTGSGIGMFRNCNFVGSCFGGFARLNSSGGNKDHFIACSFNVDAKSTYFSYGASYTDCRIIFKTTGSQVFVGCPNEYLKNCYLTANLTYTGQINFHHEAKPINNCILDITAPNATSVRYTGNTTSSYPISIINITHCPTAVEYAGNVVGVDNTNWHNIPYLQDLGFLCAEPPTVNAGE